MLKEHGGPVTTADELRFAIADRYRRNLEKASSSLVVMEPILQIGVRNVLDPPAQKILLIEMRIESRFRDPPGSVGEQVNIGKTAQRLSYRSVQRRPSP